MFLSIYSSVTEAGQQAVTGEPHKAWKTTCRDSTYSPDIQHAIRLIIHMRAVSCQGDSSRPPIHVQPTCPKTVQGRLHAAIQSHANCPPLHVVLSVIVYVLYVPGEPWDAVLSSRWCPRKTKWESAKIASARVSRYAVPSVVRGYVLPGIVESRKKCIRVNRYCRKDWAYGSRWGFGLNRVWL